MSEKVNILGVNIDKVTIPQAIERIMEMLEERKKCTVFTPNSEIIYTAYKDKEFSDILNSADLLTPDGIGVVYASKILKNPLSERAPGYDIAKGILEKVSESGHRIYFFGGKPGIAEKAKKNIEKKYPFIQIVGTHNGYFTNEELPDIISDINRLNTDILFVCLGAPKQEKWIFENKNELCAKVQIGIGGSLDVFAGEVERAPEFWCNLGLEWFYRLIKEPWRFKRMLALPKFAFTVLFKGKRCEKGN